MERPGESLNRPVLPYPGRELLYESKISFFALKSDIKHRYIYDLGLSTGEVLYEFAGGMGICEEKYVIYLHELLKMSYAESLIHEVFEKDFKGRWGPAKFNRLKRDVNLSLKNPSKRTIAKLYCLLACSGFRHRFDRFDNFSGQYFPHALNTVDLSILNKKLINSDFILTYGKLFSLDEKLLTNKSIVHFHMPHNGGKYGQKFIWNLNKKLKTLEYFDYLNDKNIDFLLTSRFIFRGRKDVTLDSWCKKYNTYVTPEFKEESSFQSSDIFITNF
jgi:hypothetical protein